MRRTCVLMTVGAIGIATAGLAQTRTARPVASIKQIQEAMVSPASDIIFNGGRAAPQTEAEWAVVRNAAVILTEAGNLFMLDGRARDAEEWMEMAGALVDAGAAALAATEARDVDAVLDAGNGIVDVCETCHVPYRDGGRQMGPPPTPDDPRE